MTVQEDPREHAFTLLETNPSLSIRHLAELVGVSKDTAHQYQREYWKQDAARGVGDIMRNAGQKPSRKLLRDMTPAELRDWLSEQQAELEDFCSYAQRYIKGRARRGQRTPTDERYEQFLTRAADLLAGLEEMREVAEQAAQEEEQEGNEHERKQGPD